MKKYGIRKAQQHLTTIVRELPVVITRYGKPIAFISEYSGKDGVEEYQKVDTNIPAIKKKPVLEVSEKVDIKGGRVNLVKNKDIKEVRIYKSDYGEPNVSKVLRVISGIKEAKEIVGRHKGLCNHGAMLGLCKYGCV